MCSNFKQGRIMEEGCWSNQSINQSMYFNARLKLNKLQTNKIKAAVDCSNSYLSWVAKVPVVQQNKVKPRGGN